MNFPILPLSARIKRFILPILTTASKLSIRKSLSIDDRKNTICELWQMVFVLFSVFIPLTDHKARWGSFQSEHRTDLIVQIALIAVMEQIFFIDKANECRRSG